MVKFIIRNLLTNANKFTKEGKIISFSDKDDQYTKLTVNDTGTGMTQHMIETLLLGKQTVTTPGTDNEKGSGLGIKLIKEFMEDMGGKIDMLSEVGKGSSVILYFPKERAAGEY
jgi:signal transduction histidine kinase